MIEKEASPGSSSKKRGPHHGPYPALGLLYSLKSVKFFKFMKAFKATKLLLTLGSMAFTVLLYSFHFGYLFAIGIVLLLLIHELGHVWATVWKGHPVSWPIFIPFVGAFIFAPPFRDAEEEAFCGYGGPLLGTIGAVSVFALWTFLPNLPAWILSLAYLGAGLNLFNLIPVSPFDGGRVTQVLGQGFGYIGRVLLACVAIYSYDLMLLAICATLVPDFSMSNRYRFPLVTAFWLAGLGIYSSDQVNHGVWNTMTIILMGIIVVILAGYWRKEQALRLEMAELGDTVPGSYDHIRMKECLDQFDNVTGRGTKKRVYPALSVGARIKWSMLYLALVAFLLGFMLYLKPLLPTHLTQI